jgi:hypothetical protein
MRVRLSSPAPERKPQLAVAHVKPWQRACLIARGVRAAVDLLSLYRELAVDGLGATLTVSDLVIMIMDQSASFGLPWWRSPSSCRGTAPATRAR